MLEALSSEAIEYKKGRKPFFKKLILLIMRLLPPDIDSLLLHDCRLSKCLTDSFSFIHRGFKKSIRFQYFIHDYTRILVVKLSVEGNLQAWILKIMSKTP